MKKKNKQQKVEKKPSIYKIDECPACKTDRIGHDFATGELFCLKCGLVII